MIRSLGTLLLLLLLFPCAIFAQSNGTISGKVTDVLSAQPIEFVTVALVAPGSNTLIKQEVTTAKGTYKFTGLADGKYNVVASFVGFDNFRSTVLLIDANHKKVDLNIGLSGGSKKLDEVVVSAKKPIYINSIDRKIYQVDQDIMAKSGSASEVLQNVPLVQVDIDGNVSLRNSNVTILINGKVSPIMGKNAAAALQQLPANSIEKIEVITNPSAKYKPDGTGGIINIVLKKNVKSGLNGGITANLGNQDRYNASANLNYRTGKVNIFGSYAVKQDYRLRLTSNYRTQRNLSTGEVGVFNDEIKASSRPFSNTATLGFTYDINDKTSIGLSGNYYFRNMHKNDLTTKYASSATDILDYDRTRNNYEYEREADATFFFEHGFKKDDHKIRLEFNMAHSPEVENNHFQNIFRTPANRANEIDNTIIKQTSDTKQLTFSYENPISDDTKLELGYDGQYNKQDLDFYGENNIASFPILTVDPNITNRFIYNENIHALYGTIEQSWKKFGAMLGLRAEYADLKSNLVTKSQVIPNHYYKVYPTLHLYYKLSEHKQLQLNYSRRVNRPEADELNPFTEGADQTNIRVGNPYLLPEIIHSVELGYQWKTDHINILPGIYYRYKYNGFTAVTTTQANGNLVTTQQNLANDQAAGVDVVFSANINDKININFTPNAFYSQIDASNLGFSAKKSTFTWSANLNSSYTIVKGTILQVNSNYRSERLTPQGRYLPSFLLNLGGRHELFKGKGSIYLTISDVFKSQRQRAKLSSNVSGVELIQNIYQRSNSRIGYIGMSYNFGVVKKKKDLTFDNSN